MKKNKNIYILNDKHIKYAKNIPLITTVLNIDSFEVEKYDAIIFTSKNGIIHLDSITNKWKKIPSYAISNPTAKEIEEFGGNLKFIGKKKHGDEFALELVDLLKNYKKVAYIGAKDVVSNLINILIKNNINCEHIPIYKTLCVDYEKKIDLPDDSIIIFSAPSTIKCFFKNINWKDSFRAISIGKTTMKYFPDNIKPILSDNTTLQSCVQTALNLK